MEEKILTFNGVEYDNILLHKIEDYFEKLNSLVSEMDDTQDVMAEMQIENILWSSAVNDHPRVLLNRLYESVLLERLRRVNLSEVLFCGEKILQEILTTKIKNRRMFHVRYKKEEYYTDEKYHLVPYAAAGGLTDINAIRLIEKIQARVKSNGTDRISIAYFGKLTDISELVSYFKSKKIELNFNRYCFQIGSQYVYQEKQSGKLLHLMDMKELDWFVKAYDIILILDDASFYKQLKSKKKFREQRRKAFINQYWKYGKSSTDLLEKCGFYSKMYEETLRYLVDYTSEMTGGYEFDDLILRSLERRIQSFDGSCADIYCYISTGGQVANRNIGYLSICKDEFYEGKNLLVYKISKDYPLKNDELVEKNLLCFEVWKLLKSISNEFYKKSGISDKVDFWKQWKIEVNFSDVKSKRDGTFQLPYKIYNIHGEGDIKRIQGLVETIFHMAFVQDTGFSCVAVYLQTIIASIFLCNANSVDGIVMSYLIKSGKKVEFIYDVETNSYTDIHKSKKSLTYRERKTMFTLIEGLNSIIIRDMNRKDQILKYDFKEKYAPDLDDGVFWKYLKDIHKVSETYGLTDMRMFLYT